MNTHGTAHHIQHPEHILSTILSQAHPAPTSIPSTSQSTTAPTTPIIMMLANNIHGTMSTTLKAVHILTTIQTTMDAPAQTLYSSLYHSTMTLHTT